MKITKRILAIGAVAVLLIGTLVVVALPAISADDTTPVVTVDEENATAVTHNLTVKVMQKVDGQMVPLSGVNVTVCTMNITYEDNRTTMVIENVSAGMTDADGNVTFVLPEGKYFIFAENNGLRGFCHVNLSEDQAYEMKMHHWNWGHMKGEKFQFMHQECDQNGSSERNASCDRAQIHNMSQDHARGMDQLQKQDGSC